MRNATTLPTFGDRSVELRDVSLHYVEVEGPGRPLLMLHGIGMDWRVWQAVSRRLAPHFHLYMLDLRGHGESGKPTHGYSLAHYAADVEDFIEALSLTGAVLLGSSLGGMVAIMVEAPDDIVTHRIVVDPPLTGGPVRDAETWRDILRLKHGPVRALTEYLRRMNPRGGALLMRMMAEMWHEAADGVLQELLDHEADYFAVDNALRAIDAPTLILQADPELGGVLSSDEAQRAVQLLQRGSLTYMPGAGHAIHAYKPAEFARIVQEFAA